MNEYQEKSKFQIQSQSKFPRSASSSNPLETHSPKPICDISFGNIPLNAPTQERSELDRKELDRNAQRDKFLKDYPEAAKMLKSIKTDENDKESLETLKKEFMKSGFTYTMAINNPDAFLRGKKKGIAELLPMPMLKLRRNIWA
jgi:hypothetical protein